jgi:hypothetical protein
MPHPKKKRATKKKLKPKAMKGLKDDRSLGNWLKKLISKFGESSHL